MLEKRYHKTVLGSLFFLLLNNLILAILNSAALLKIWLVVEEILAKVVLTKGPSRIDSS